MLVSLDCTEAAVDEALACGANLIVSHHPIVFKGLKRFTGANYVERTVMAAIRQGIQLYAIHTNLDNVADGVNQRLASLCRLHAGKPTHPSPQSQRPDAGRGVCARRSC